ncbi:MAG: hypothetical protein AAF206_07635 [Bacteroidota bacterium]
MSKVKKGDQEGTSVDLIDFPYAYHSYTRPESSGGPGAVLILIDAPSTNILSHTIVKAFKEDTDHQLFDLVVYPVDLDAKKLQLLPPIPARKSLINRAKRLENIIAHVHEKFGRSLKIGFVTYSASAEICSTWYETFYLTDKTEATKENILGIFMIGPAYNSFFDAQYTEFKLPIFLLAGTDDDTANIHGWDFASDLKVGMILHDVDHNGYFENQSSSQLSKDQHGTSYRPLDICYAGICSFFDALQKEKPYHLRETLQDLQQKYEAFFLRILFQHPSDKSITHLLSYNLRSLYEGIEKRAGVFKRSDRYVPLIKGMLETFHQIEDNQYEFEPSDLEDAVKTYVKKISEILYRHAMSNKSYSVTEELRKLVAGFLDQQRDDIDWQDPSWQIELTQKLSDIHTRIRTAYFLLGIILSLQKLRLDPWDHAVEAWPISWKKAQSRIYPMSPLVNYKDYQYLSIKLGQHYTDISISNTHSSFTPLQILVKISAKDSEKSHEELITIPPPFVRDEFEIDLENFFEPGNFLFGKVFHGRPVKSYLSHFFIPLPKDRIITSIELHFQSPSGAIMLSEVALTN